MEVSGGIDPAVTIGWEVVWAPEPLKKLWRREKSDISIAHSKSKCFDGRR
jgi:hypothetical protein